MMQLVQQFESITKLDWNNIATFSFDYATEVTVSFVHESEGTLHFGCETENLMGELKTKFIWSIYACFPMFIVF